MPANLAAPTADVIAEVPGRWARTATTTADSRTLKNGRDSRAPTKGSP